MLLFYYCVCTSYSYPRTGDKNGPGDEASQGNEAAVGGTFAMMISAIEELKLVCSASVPVSSQSALSIPCAIIHSFIDHCFDSIIMTIALTARSPSNSSQNPAALLTWSVEVALPLLRLGAISSHLISSRSR